MMNFLTSDFSPSSSAYIRLDYVPNYLIPRSTIDLKYSNTFNNIPNSNDFYFTKLQDFPQIVHERTINLSETNIQKLISKSASLQKLNNIQNLKENWNGYGADAIPDTVLSLCRNIVMVLDVQPDIYPTGRRTIQMEYEIEDRSYLEFEVYENLIRIMRVPKRQYANAEKFEVLSKDYYTLRAIVKDFCGGNDEWKDSTVPMVQKRYIA